MSLQITVNAALTIKKTTLASGQFSSTHDTRKRFAVAAGSSALSAHCACHGMLVNTG